jgi:hypothetical protein
MSNVHEQPKDQSARPAKIKHTAPKQGKVTKIKTGGRDRYKGR